MPQTGSNRLQKGDIVRHFKGKYYKVQDFAKHSESLEDYVVYQALYAPFGLWIRPFNMFMEPVDKVKYPNVIQEHRFEKVSEKELLELKVKI